MNSNDLLIEMEEFCNLNQLDYEKELIKILNNGFTTLKYGPTPTPPKIKENPLKRIKKVASIKEATQIKKDKQKPNNNQIDIYGEK